MLALARRCLILGRVITLVVDLAHAELAVELLLLNIVLAYFTILV